jgi:hypothetical protein
MDNADLGDVISTVRDFIRERLIPHEAEIDASDEMPGGVAGEAAPSCRSRISSPPTGSPSAAARAALRTTRQRNMTGEAKPAQEG